MRYLILKDVEDWIASKDVQFFYREIHLSPEGWKKNIEAMDDTFFILKQ